MAFRIGDADADVAADRGRVPELPPAPARRQHESRLTVSRQQLLDAVRRVGLLARDTTPVRMEFNALGVKLSQLLARSRAGRRDRRGAVRGRGPDRRVQPPVPGRRAHGRDRGIDPSGRARRAEAGRRARRRRRVHLPRDARAAAGAGQLTACSARLPRHAPRLGRAARLPQPRAYDGSIRSPTGSIVAVGPNGEGKTNLLEGIYFLYALGVAADRRPTRPLVREGADAAYVARRVRDARRAGCWSRWRSRSKGASRVQGEPVAGATQARSPPTGARGALRPVRPPDRHR